MRIKLDADSLPGAAAAALMAGQLPQPRESAGFNELAAKIVDLKGVARPGRFSGEASHWREWKFKFETSAALLGMDEVLDAIPLATMDLHMHSLSEGLRLRARVLYSILAQVCSGKALAIVRTAERLNGIHAWWLLLREYEPSLASRKMAMLSSLLTPKFTMQQFWEQILGWERQIQEFENVQGCVFPGEFKCAVISRWAPTEIREYLRLTSADTLADFNQLKASLQSHYHRTRYFDLEFEEESTAAPMEVDLVKKKWQGQQRCFVCGKLGHRAAQCRQRLQQKGAPSGSSTDKGRGKGETGGQGKGGGAAAQMEVLQLWTSGTPSGSVPPTASTTARRRSSATTTTTAAAVHWELLEVR